MVQALGLLPYECDKILLILPFLVDAFLRKNVDITCLHEKLEDKMIPNVQKCADYN